MNDYTFTLRFLSPGSDLDALSLEVYERIDDASLMGPTTTARSCSVRPPLSSLPLALGVAFEELRSVLPEVQILRVEDDDLATMADIARAPAARLRASACCRGQARTRRLPAGLRACRRSHQGLALVRRRRVVR